MSREKYVWRRGDVRVTPINLRDCSKTIPCATYGQACLPLWAELEDGRVDQLLEEWFYDAGEDRYGLWFSDPDR